MLFLSLALVAQPVTLEAEPFAAAITCARVANTGIVPGTSLEGAAVFNYYLMRAMAEDPQGGGLSQRMPHVEALVRERNRVRMPAATAHSLLAQCDARFPAARKPGPFTLPQPGFQRDMLCTLSLTVMRGEAESESERTGDRKPVERYATGVRNYEPGVNNGLLANGYDSWQAFFDAPLPGFVRIWSEKANPYVVSEACFAALRTTAGPRQKP